MISLVFPNRKEIRNSKNFFFEIRKIGTCFVKLTKRIKIVHSTVTFEDFQDLKNVLPTVL